MMTNGSKMFKKCPKDDAPYLSILFQFTKSIVWGWVPSACFQPSEIP
jgi:hypothetical protein